MRRHFVRRLLPNVELVTLGLRGLVPVAVAAAVTFGLRGLLWGGERTAVQAVAELVLFLATCALVTWWVERPLLREAARESRSPRLTAAAEPAIAEPV